MKLTKAYIKKLVLEALHEAPSKKMDVEETIDAAIAVLSHLGFKTAFTPWKLHDGNTLKLLIFPRDEKKKVSALGKKHEAAFLKAFERSGIPASSVNIKPSRRHGRAEVHVLLDTSRIDTRDEDDMDRAIWDFDISKDDPKEVLRQIQQLAKKHKGTLFSTNEGPHGIDERNIMLDIITDPEEQEDARRVDRKWLEELSRLIKRDFKKRSQYFHE